MKGLFVAKFHKQSQIWLKGSKIMEKILSLDVDVQKGDYLMPWDVRSENRHFYMQPCICDWFVFR